MGLGWDSQGCQCAQDPVPHVPGDAPQQAAGERLNHIHFPFHRNSFSMSKYTIPHNTILETV